MTSPFLLAAGILSIVLANVSAEPRTKRPNWIATGTVDAAPSQDNYNSNCTADSPMNCREQELEKMVLQLLKSTKKPPANTPVKDWFGGIWNSIRNALGDFITKLPKYD
ncbi:uncharacterized protein LOC111074360 [Drosophila obscura]|uniref:uncharacterized protein LOC111074360 n=1 Tax=Drosophila obscura TaxID=7282 RepID=UPI001BB2C6AF|nr:uncharacterized protein LOC111074360 [Drosophila obscura]